MCGAMWKTFVIFEILQVTVLTGQQHEISATATIPLAATNASTTIKGTTTNSMTKLSPILNASTQSNSKPTSNSTALTTATLPSILKTTPVPPTSKTTIPTTLKAPVPPDIKILNTTTSEIIGQIVNISNEASLNVNGPGENEYEISVNGGSFKINKLQSGQCYTIHAIVKFQKKRIESTPRTECTKPDAPSSISVQQVTETSITINIQPGTGNVEYFYVRKNGTFYLQLEASNNHTTQVIIEDLTPGTLYDNVFTVYASSNGLNSSSVRVPSQATKPDAPSSITVQQVTETSITINIKPGTGNVKYLYVRKNGTFYLQTEASNNHTTQVIIEDLTPGTLYDNVFTVYASSNGLNSSSVRVPSQATRPSKPLSANVVKKTQTSMSIDIIHGNGRVQFFYIFNSNKYLKTFNASKGKNTTVIINNLHPGTVYKDFSVLAASYGLNSSSILVPESATEINLPTVEIGSVTNTTICIIITERFNKMTAYTVSMNGQSYFITRLEKNNPVCFPKEKGKLLPGACYIVTIVIVIDDKSTTKTITKKACTSPNPPTAQLERRAKTSLDIIIQRSGKVDYCLLQVNESVLNVSFGDQEKLQKITIHNLTEGRIYALTVFAVAHGQHSKANSYNFATYPDSPSNITVYSQHTNSINISIIHGNGNVEYFSIFANGIFQNDVKVVTAYQTDTVIDGLMAGSLYNIEIFAISNLVNSTNAATRKISTVPNNPSMVNITDQTTYSIAINVTHGEGKVQFLEVLMNHAFYDCLNASQYSYTLAVIKNLAPGMIYSTFGIVAVSNGLHSSVLSIPEHPTNPSVPDVTFINHTNESFSINLIKGDGNVSSYGILTQNQLIQNEPYLTDNQSVSINELDAGKMFHLIVFAKFRGLTSKNTTVQNIATYPNPPKEVNVMTQSSKSISLIIEHGTGGIESFYIFVDGVFNMRIEPDNGTKSNVVVKNLLPGSIHEFQIMSESNDLNSTKSVTKTYPTKPSIPSTSYVNSSTNILTILINNGTGGVSDYEIFVNDNDPKSEIYMSSSQLVLITDLKPGTIYSVYVLSLANHLKSNPSKPIVNATFPDVPVVSFVNKTTETMDVLVKKGTGGVEGYKIFINDKLHKTYSYETERQNVVIQKLIPGTKYRITANAVFQNLSSKTSIVTQQATFPSFPDVSYENSTTNSITVYAKKRSGNIENYAVQVDGNIHQNETYLDENQKIYIHGLMAGEIYEVVVIAQSNHINSNPSTTLRKATYPEKPSIQFVKSTTSIITILLNKGDGGIGGYELYVDQQWKANNTYEAGKQQFQITGRIPGTRSKVYAFAIANNLKSIKSDDLYCLTYPSPPKTLRVIGRTNTTIILKIEPGDGSVDSFLVLVNGSFHSKVTVDSSKTSMTVSSLEAGSLYDFRVKATSNNLNSSSSAVVINATYPSPPTSVRIKEMNKDSVTIEIVKGKGRVKRFVVSVNGRDINVPASLNKDATVYTISGLDSATTYPIKVSAVSNGAYNTELASIQMSLTTKKDPIPVAIGGVFGGCAALVVILIIVFSWRRQALCFKKNIQKEVEQGKMNAGFEEEVELEDNRRKRPIKVSEFHRHVEMMSGNSNMGFSQEFKELGILSPKHSTDVSQIQENRPKNRYTNILPFDHSRVKLIGIEDETGSDFINANYIPGKRSKREFIATQGPLPSTKEEMWRMIWEQNVSSVVMLTQLIERGRKKCEIYWPENTNEKMFLGDIIVEVETLSHLSDYTLRTIALRLGDVERRIKHYNYISWPDMGTPKTSSNMINFVDTVRKEIQPNMNGPIIVHCSAGVGRTGTFIVMDILMQEIRSKCTHVDIFGTVLNMRNYRLNMVQTEDQYVFIHNCVRDLLDVSDDEEEDRIEEQNAYLNEPIYQNVNE